ncbi:hypothetical protein A9G41_12325 [Gilliamella sp. Nev5-1]|uniref:DUF6651 domain-containing protein n=1 Tax=Gilliamella sp. Nev5-1 TaxID=3120251 RepID=UPI0008285B87|nr:DUF6651 domain-containing protein [Gilliamella apicola]OCG66597.1 hypothetical protein A9G41_12325 [Gilliamella apicola]
MKLKTIDVNGTTYAVIENGNPVYVHDDGKEIPFDAVASLNKISALNGEAKAHREAKEKVEAELKKFANIADPAKAIEALDIVTKLDQKKLIDVGEVDKVKAEITKVYQTQVDTAKAESEALKSQLYNEMIGGRFNSSKYIKDKVAIPPDFVQSRFGSSFKIEDGKVVAYDQSGNKIYSRAKPGEIAEFDEALEFLIDNYPQKDYILKASGNQGGGAQQSQHQAGQKTMKRSSFDALGPLEKQAALKDGVQITD